jgi:N-methylhydantoinase B
MSLDPVTLAVIQNGLRQVASEMDLVHEKTSFSPVHLRGIRSLQRDL